MNVSQILSQCEAIRKELGRVIVGKDDVISNVLISLLSDGHILIEDVPGLAKTLLARSIAMIADMKFARIQFTPDLLPGDITGANIFDQRESRFDFRPGPIFANLVLADEINRASPKTQSAMLEAMQEGQVTIEGEQYPLESPFLVCATQNPIELEGTYPLPEAQLDRFLARIRVGYPQKDDELEILMRRQKRKHDEIELSPIVDKETFLEMQRGVEEVFTSEKVGEYIVRIVGETREDPRTQIGASPRGSLAVFKLARAAAAIEGRDFVTPEDVKRVASMALSHRLILKPESWVRGVREESIVDDILRRVPTPKTLEKE